MREAEQLYWNEYYRKASAPSVPSQFAAFIVNELAPKTVVEVGCGNGRDALFFALHAERVLGFDRSEGAIEACNVVAAKGGNVRFECRTVSDPAWVDVVDAERTEGALLIYARFVLHALSESEEYDFLKLAASTLTRPNDRVAVEFRTHLDHGRPKVTAAHFRRYIEPSQLVFRAAKCGLRPIYSVEGFGMAKYRDDDAHVARLIFEREAKLGDGAVKVNSGGVVSGEWLGQGDDDKVLTLRHGDLALRKITPSIDIPGAERKGFKFALSAALINMLPPGKLVVSDSSGNELREDLAQPWTTIGAATDGGALLRQRFDQGYVVDKWGALKLPFGASERNREAHRQTMAATVSYFQERHGVTLFPHYGTLLGLERGGAFLDHDDDVDMSVAIYASSLEEVVDRYLGLMTAVQRDGHEVGTPNFGQFHVKLQGRALPPVDVFLTWGLNPLEFNTYFGVAGRISTPLTFEPFALEGVMVQAPVQRKEILELTYGPDWRVPDPNFQWRASADVGAVMRRLKAVGDARTAVQNP